MYSQQAEDYNQHVRGENGDKGHGRLWEDSIGIVSDNDHDSMHNSFRSHRTDVTGVSGLTMSSAFGGIPLPPGEMSNEPFERPLSAPPPPGFAGGAEERPRKSENALRHGRDGDSNTSSKNGDKNSSFGNLADYLGAGLAQSMEDAARGDHVGAFNSPNEINFHRQTRHAANRLLGTSGDDAGKQGIDGGDDYAVAPSSASVGSGVVERGFPSSLSTPKRNHDSDDEDAEARRQALRGSTTPVQMFPSDRRSNRGAAGIGTHVSEPDGEGLFGRAVSGVVSRRMDDSGNPGVDYSLEGTMLSSNAREFRPSLPFEVPIPSREEERSMADSVKSSDLNSHQAESELKPFLWDADHKGPSRTLAVLHVSYLRVPEVRAACETFGVLETFRSDFSSSGIYLVSYYDIRSAQYASAELQAILQRLVVMQRGSDEVVVQFCIPLNSSSQSDDSQIVISDLPHEYDEYTLRSMLSSYGSIRSMITQGQGTFVIEFHNIQDAKQAQLELDSTQPFGENTFVEMGMRSPGVRKRGRELLALISRWRQMSGRRSHSRQSDANSVGSGARSASSDPWRGRNTGGGSSFLQDSNEVVGLGAGYGSTRPQGNRLQPHEATQLILGPDGRYTPVVVQSQIPYSSFAPMGATAIDPRQQQIIQGPDGQIYLAPVPAGHGGPGYGRQGAPVQGSRYGFPPQVITHPHHHDANRRAPQNRTPYYTHVVNDASSLSGRSHRSAYSTGTDAERDTRHLMLDLDAVESGQDSRTSLMVRNIPNKYTQQMLLSEFEENGHGPGVIDFFYLPIDFKNRCNRGYAFINFVNYRDILAFHKQYYGKHWRTFNSDKICDITYARIQGKAAMLKRFENSALMEKDEEYKPLVFSSSGPNKGQRLPFPDPSTRAS